MLHTHDETGLPLNVAVNTTEYELLTRAHECSKNVLNEVNRAVQECENYQRLVEIQRHLDSRPIVNSSNQALAEFKVCTVKLFARIAAVEHMFVCRAANLPTFGRSHPLLRLFTDIPCGNYTKLWLLDDALMHTVLVVMPVHAWRVVFIGLPL